MIGKPKPASRDRLIDAAIAVFGAKGYESASTRDIAASAGVNHAAISYYFSGKEPLYAACIDRIIATAQAEIGETMRHIGDSSRAKILTGAQGWALLDLYIETMVPFFLICRDHADASGIVMRELADPTPAFERLYDGMMRDMHELLALLIARLTGRRPGTRAAILSAHAALGQLTGFKNGRAILTRRLGIADYSDKDVRDIIATIKINMRGIVAAMRKD